MSYRDPKTRILYPSKEWYQAKVNPETGKLLSAERQKETLPLTDPKPVPSTEPIIQEEKEEFGSGIDLNEPIDSGSLDNITMPPEAGYTAKDRLDSIDYQINDATYGTITDSVDRLDQAINSYPEYQSIIPEGERKGFFQSIKDFLTAPTTDSADLYSQELSDAGLPQISDQITAVDKKLVDLYGTYQGEMQKLDPATGQFKLGSILRGEQRLLANQYEIRKQTLLLERESLQGNYDRALNRANALFELQKEDVEEQRERKAQYLELLMDEARSEKDYQMEKDLTIYQSRLAAQEARDEAVFKAKQEELNDIRELAEQYPFAGIVIGKDDYASALSKIAPFKQQEWTTENIPTQAPELLSVSEAERLGLPYGTTKEQAAQMGIVPKGTTDEPLPPTSFNIKAGIVGMTESQVLDIFNSDKMPDWFRSAYEQEISATIMPGTQGEQKMFNTWKEYQRRTKESAEKAAGEPGINVQINTNPK